MSYANIFNAIEDIITTEFGTDAVQLPNQFIDTSNRVYWLRVTHLPVEATVLSLGTTGSNLRAGLTQVDVFVKAGTGQPTQSDTVVSLFTRGTQSTLTDGSIFNFIAYRDGGDLVEDNQWMDRVIVRWEAETLF